MREFDYGEIEASTGGFAAERVVGKGSHGCVYIGVLRGGNRIAVKTPFTAKLNDEIELLSALRSPYLVSPLGFSRCPFNGERLLVLEFMPNGSLHHLLHKAAAPSSFSRRATVALQIAKALATLHAASPPVVHRDVKPENVLFDADWTARLGDFSLAVRCPAAAAPPAGTIGYLDPSYNEPSKLGPENDVFSFGVLLLELISGRPAMACAGELTSVVAWAAPLIAAGGLEEICDSRLPPPRKAERATVACLLAIAARCVSSERSYRPSMAEIVRELRCMAGREFSLLSRFRFSVPIWCRRRTKKVMCTEDGDIDPVCVQGNNRGYLRWT